MFFNSPTLGSQSVVIKGNYLSHTATCYNAVLDNSLFTPKYSVNFARFSVRSL